jgi:hypothetical protein
MPPFPGDGGVGVVFVVEGENVDMSEVIVALVEVEEEEDVGIRDPEMKKWADSAIWLLPKLIVALAS